MRPEVFRPTIAVTIGDPAGVGPEVTLKALSQASVQALASWLVVGDRAALDKAGASCGIDVGSLPITIRDPRIIASPGEICFGRLSANCGRAAAEYVRAATALCMGREADAMVTAPLNKEAVTMSGISFSGHTEYIAEICGATESRMLLCSKKLSVVHVTTHVSLRQAIASGTERILRTIELGNEAMNLLGFDHPRIGVCGLNPHAGEHGLFGSDEAERIIPAIDAARTKGLDVRGPEAPDTIFLRASRGAYDLVVAMYHDQGHIAMKLIDFENTVNISLGLPIIRTSVDHGTAFDIAGQNKADPQNMIAALTKGTEMANGRKRRATGEPHS
jgi:4-hydroxythreonine-4-phosphate dehydrogenase